MATFLRILIVIIGILLTLAGPLGIGVALAAGLGDSQVWALEVGIFASLALTMPPYLAGVVSSYWSWNEPESRRRVQRALFIAVLIQVVGAVALIVTSVIVGRAVLVAVAAVVVAIALMPALIALGRAAKRRDIPLSSGDDWVDTTRDSVRKGYRNGAIGFAIGAFAAIAFVVGLGALVDSPREQFDADVLPLCFSFASIGAALSMIFSSLPISRNLRRVAGSEYSVLRKIARVVVRGKSDALTEDEEQRASRYASVMSRWLPFQAMSYVALYLGFFSNQFLGFSEKSAGPISGLRIFSLATVVIAVVVVFPIFGLRIRTVRRYAATHPVTA